MRRPHGIGLALTVLFSLAPTATDAGVAALVTPQLVLTADFPAAFTFAPDGRIFYGLYYRGEIRVFDPATGQDTLFFTVPDEDALAGLAIHPQYPSKKFVYAYVGRELDTGFEVQLLRIRERLGVGAAMRVLRRWPANSVYGGRLQFGPDGQLYAMIGVITDEATDPANAQKLGHPAGKLLRLRPNGRRPPDNPISRRLVYAYGFRNSFGFDFDPETGALWQEDNGPECNDEVNLVNPGGNYGWGPSATCASPPSPPANTNQDGPAPIAPVWWYGSNVAPTGLAFCAACGLPESEGSLLMGTWVTTEIRALGISADRRSVTSESTIYTHPVGVLSLEAAPDGTIYFSDPSGVYRLTT